MSTGLSLQRIPSTLRNRSVAAFRRAAFAVLAPRRDLAASDALVICADPRGGSTWLYEVLSRISGVAGLWEPLNIGEVNHFRRIGFGWRHYIPENDTSSEARLAFQQLFEGRCREPYVLHRTSINDFREAERLLVKFCRATQLLPWLTREFGFARKPVHLVRHPCAIVASQMKYGAWSSVSPRLPEGEVMSNPLMRPHADLLLRIDTVESRLAAFWAMTNSVALNHPQRNARWITISYEDLLSSPVETLSIILDDWQVPLDSDIDKIIATPSKTTLGSSPIALGKQQAQLSHWQQALDPSQIRRVLDTVEALGVGIYSSGIHPKL